MGILKPQLLLLFADPYKRGDEATEEKFGLFSCTAAGLLSVLQLFPL